MNTPKTSAAASFLLLAALSLPAHAQWSNSAGIGMRHAQFSEYDRSGKEAVSEGGWAPGLELAAQYQAPTWISRIETEFFGSRVDYNGQLQSGAPFQSRTRSEQIQVRALFIPRLTQNASLVAGVEWQRWHRDIQGMGNVLGMKERYDNWRALAGLVYRWNIADVALATDGLLILARPEKMQIDFQNGIYDRAELKTRSATGMRIGTTATFSRWPGIRLSANYDWMKTPRSDDYPLSRNGATAGIAAQPEHVQQAFTVMLSYVF